MSHTQQSTTQQPLTESEWMLYKVLQKANLTQYFEMFVAQGGDDVYQLCEAGEEEFLEIMALVGMAGKPLHVRRLQRALHEWLTNPASFKSSDDLRPLNSPPAKGSILASVPLAISSASCRFWMQPGVSGGHKINDDGILRGSLELNGVDGVCGKSLVSPGLGNSLDAELNLISDRTVNVSPSPSASSTGYTSENFLSENHMKALEMGANEMAKVLPLFAPRPLNTKKPIDKEIEEVLNCPDDVPNRMEILRKYSAIYGRFDSKRKSDKQMNFHEMCVNEAAAQLCSHRPALLTRREDLFSLARTVVRDSGLQFARSHSKRDREAQPDLGPCSKQIKLESYPCESSPSQTPTGRIGFSRSMSTQFLESFDQAEEPLTVQTIGSVVPPGNDGDEELTAKSASSLVDEGLRIAQQYGLGEFEEKLREMKREALEVNKSAEDDVDDEDDAEDPSNSNCSESKNGLTSLSGQSNS